MSLEDKRQFASFGGRCVFNCNHCYTFSHGYDINTTTSVQNIVSSLKDNKFEIVYISGHRENFVNPDEGLALCEEIFKEYNVDLLITTRNVFGSSQLSRLENLHKSMKEKGKALFFCSSIPATSSYKKLEPCSLIPKPYERMDFLRAVFDLGIFTLLTIRPLCPNEFIPIEEALEIVDKCHSFSSAIISSGIFVNDSILGRLKSFPAYDSNGKEPLMKCLEKKDVSGEYVKVDNEFTMIKNRCQKYGKELFDHSCPAIEYIKEFSTTNNHIFRKIVVDTISDMSNLSKSPKKHTMYRNPLAIMAQR
jgi:DNA repair photolyase